MTGRHHWQGSDDRLSSLAEQLAAISSAIWANAALQNQVNIV